MNGGLPKALQRRLDPAERYGLRLTLAVVAVVLVAVPFSFLVFEVVGKGPLARLDGRLANRLNASVHAHPIAVHVLEAVTQLGSPTLLWIVIAVAVVVTLRQGTPRLAVFLVTTTAGAVVLSTVVKVLVDRPRPIVDHPIITAHGKSFPSGHALVSTVVYGSLLLTFLPAFPRRARRPVVVAAIVLVLAVASSRVLLGVHFLSDVVGGGVLGIAWLSTSAAVFDVWRIERGQRPADPLEEGVEPEAATAFRDGAP